MKNKMSNINKLPDILDLADVLKLTGLKRSTIYTYVQNNQFPKPKKLGIRAVRWSKKEVLEWLKDKGFDISEERI